MHDGSHALQFRVSVKVFSTPYCPLGHFQVTELLASVVRVNPESQAVHVFSEVHSLHPIGHLNHTPLFI